MPGGPGLPWGWVVSPLDPLGLGAPRGVPPAVGLFSLSDVLLVVRGACPARLLAERKRTSSSRPGKGRSGPSEDHARLLGMASRPFPGLRVAGKAYLELPFPRALVRARPDLLLVGGGLAVGIKGAKVQNPESLPALGLVLAGFARRNGLRPRLYRALPGDTLREVPIPRGPEARALRARLARGVAALSEGRRVPGPGCGGCPLRHGCPAPAI
jgi:hypothetical protein